MPHGDFNMCSIEDYVFDEKYDVVVSNSVIHYLNREEFETFINKATAIAERFILISDIPNLQTKTEAEEYRKKSCFKMALRKNTRPIPYLLSADGINQSFQNQNWDCKLIPIGSLGSSKQI